MYVRYAGGTLIAGFAPSQCYGGRLEVKLWETDPLGGDDYFGSATWENGESGYGKYFVFFDPNAFAAMNWTYVPG